MYQLQINDILQNNKQDSRPSWDMVFMEFCQVLSRRSTCLRLKTAAILVKNYNVIAVGYNGCCSKDQHCCDYWKSEYASKYKNQVTWEAFLQSEFFYNAHHEYANLNEIHGELNAVLNAAKNNSSSENSTMYSLYAPCINCAKLIVASKIHKVVFRNYYKRDINGIEFLTKHNILTTQI